MKVKVDIVTSDDIKIYYTGKVQDFTARYIINCSFSLDRNTLLLPGEETVQYNLIGKCGQ